MNIKTKAPARIDLAGGTLDLWPLYLFFDHASTINFAVNQYAEVEIEVGVESKVDSAAGIKLSSEDRNVSHTFKSYGELLESFQGSHKAKVLPPALWVHAKLARHFFSFWRKTAPVHIKTRCAAPAGAGLGGSSALNIALCVALRKLTLAKYTDEELIGLARDLETTVIDIPAGVQDYWSALFGGVQAIRMEAGRVHRKVFTKQKSFLEKHIILCYSGQSRNSGINNWAVYKGFIDGDEGIREAFRNIVTATQRVEEALERHSYEKLLEAVELEWNARQKLAPTIVTPEMNATITKGKSFGADAAKVCGAGGGGCFIFAVPDGKKDSTTEKLKKAGVQVIDFLVSEEGCVVNE